jgi:hypothetical protein
MLRLLAIPVALAAFLFLASPPYTEAPATAHSLPSGSLRLCNANSDALQPADGSLQAAPAEQDDAAGEENDDLVSVQMWVFALALAAAALGLLGYLLRRLLGLEQMPPPEEEPSHH